MDRTKYTGYKATSSLDLLQIVQEFYYRSCQIPPEYQSMIDDIITAHMQSLNLSLGNLELCFLRTLKYKNKTDS